MPLRDLNEFQAETAIAMPSVRVYNSGAITATTSVSKTLTFDSERYDRWSMHDTSSNSERLVCPTRGIYLVKLTVQFAANATGTRIAQIFANNGGAATSIARQTIIPGSAASAVGMCVSADWLMDKGDWFEARVFQTSGGDLDIEAAGNYTPEFMCAFHSRG